MRTRKATHRGRIVQLIMALMLIVLVGVIFIRFSDSGSTVGPHSSDDNMSGQGAAIDPTDEPDPTAAPTPKPKQGKIAITSLESSTGQPIADAEIAIADAATSRIVETVRTAADGTAVSGPLDYGTSYKVTMVGAPQAFEPDSSEVRVDISAPEQTVTTQSKLREHIKAVERAEDGTVVISSVYMDMPVVMQKPELPNGCEITSLTAVLNYYGYEADKLDMADNYLPKEGWTRKDGKLYGADPYKAYAGNPREQPGGFFSFAPPIVEAAETYLSQAGGGNAVLDISGSSRERVLERLMDGIPVVAWTTLDLASPPRVTYSWYLHDTGELFNAPVNLHVVVLNGYDADTNTLHIMNPLEGQVTVNADTFFQSYEQMGSHALVVMPEQQ